MGNLTASRAWFARARRLVDHEPPCLEQGWVAVAAMGCDVDDPVELLAAAELALDRARRFGDVNLETKALAEAGLAHVQAGRLADGMAMLDEAMALACGPADDSAAAAKSVCSFFTACYHATDFERASTWASLLRQHGLIGVTPGGPAFLDVNAASAALATLDVVPAPADLALIDRLGSVPVTPERSVRTAVLAQDGRWWVASWDGTHARLQDSKGLRYLAELVARPGVESHALDLVDRVEGVSPDGAVDRRALGDAGVVADARAAYRRRIEELRAEADDALACGDLDAAEACQAELDQLVGQLSQAFGLGGRDRRAASAAERARLNVTRALRTALTRLAQALPAAGDQLDRRVRTGLYCAYEPADADEVRWIVQP